MAYERVNWENLPSTKTPVNADNLNKMNDAIDQNANNIGGKDYDATSTYDVGDIVKYQGQLYICTTAITTAEAWNSNHWQATDVLSKSEIKEISFTKNDANAIFYESVYATENEVQICGDIRYSYTSSTNLKAFTIDSKYLPIINNENKKLRYPISTDKGPNGYAEVNQSGEVYIHTNGVATAAIINIRYRYK